MQRFQRLIALVAFMTIGVSTSAIADNRSPQGSDLTRMAAELEQRRNNNSGVASILDAMNRERRAKGLLPLRLNTKLSQAAGDRIRDMFAKNYFAHVSPDGLDPFVWVDQRGYRYRLIGENLAVGFSGVSVVNNWMRSAGHRENILHRGFDEVGIAIADGAPKRGYRGPTVVAMYGTAMRAR